MGDPYDDFERWDREQTEALDRRPVCSRCGDHIQDEEAYEIEGKLYCIECVEDMKVYLDYD